jgi:hypothetical protein
VYLLVFTHIFTRISIFKGLIARRLYKSFGVKGLNSAVEIHVIALNNREEHYCNRELNISLACEDITTLYFSTF